MLGRLSAKVNQERKEWGRPAVVFSNLGFHLNSFERPSRVRRGLRYRRDCLPLGFADDNGKESGTNPPKIRSGAEVGVIRRSRYGIAATLNAAALHARWVRLKLSNLFWDQGFEQRNATVSFSSWIIPWRRERLSHVNCFCTEQLW